MRGAIRRVRAVAAQCHRSMRTCCAHIMTGSCLVFIKQSEVSLRGAVTAAPSTFVVMRAHLIP